MGRLRIHEAMSKSVGASVNASMVMFASRKRCFRNVKMK